MTTTAAAAIGLLSLSVLFEAPQRLTVFEELSSTLELPVSEKNYVFFQPVLLTLVLLEGLCAEICTRIVDNGIIPKSLHRINQGLV